MTKPVRILHLEDDANDAELVLMHLNSEQWAYDMMWVKSETEFSAALKRGGFDVILADNTGPSFTGMSALTLAKQECPGVPFLFLSGAATSKAVAQAIESGAAGYVLKDKLSLLIPGIERALGKK